MLGLFHSLSLYLSSSLSLSLSLCFPAKVLSEKINLISLHCLNFKWLSILHISGHTCFWAISGMGMGWKSLCGATIITSLCDAKKNKCRCYESRAWRLGMMMKKAWWLSVHDLCNMYCYFVSALYQRGVTHIADLRQEKRLHTWTASLCPRRGYVCDPGMNSLLD